MLGQNFEVNGSARIMEGYWTKCNFNNFLFSHKTRRPCGWLGNPETPQAIDPMGGKLYWCRCGEFMTTTPEALSSHVSSFHRRERIFRAASSLVALACFWYYYGLLSFGSIYFYYQGILKRIF